MVIVVCRDDRGHVIVKDGAIQKIQLATEAEQIETIAHGLEKLLGIKSLSAKNHPYVVYDISHLVRSPIALLGFIFAQIKLAPPSTFKKEFRTRLKSFPQFFNLEKYDAKYNEYIEKCITVLLLSQIIVPWDDIKDEQAVNGKNLDLAFIRSTDTIFVEVSRITIVYYLELLEKYNRGHFHKIDNRQFNSIPLYYEVVFTQEPTAETLKNIVTKLEELMVANIFPMTVAINEHCEIHIDRLEARYKEKQLPREKINSTNYLKLMEQNGNDGKWFTLAYQFDFKSIENKISEEIKQHSLDKLNNIWISLHVPGELLNELESDKDKEKILHEFIAKFDWLEGLLLFSISLGAISEICYLILRRQNVS